MTADSTDIVDQAIAWHLRQSAMTADDWRAFVVWLEADAGHAAAFDRIALDDALLDDARLDDALLDGARLDARAAAPRAPSLPANDVAPAAGPRRRIVWRWAAVGSALAAGIAALLMPLVLAGRSDPYEQVTRPGQRQELALADGTRIEMSGGTRLRLDRADPRVATLEAGEAMFHVRHDAADPFTLRSGDLTVRDLGTVFDVTRDGQRLDVQVVEGAVLFQPEHEAVTLTPGTALSAREDRNEVTVSHVAPDAIGGWRDGRLSFAGEPLASVVAAIERQAGVQIELAPQLVSRPFTGAIRSTGSADRDAPHLAALIGTEWAHDKDVWRLYPVRHATP